MSKYHKNMGAYGGMTVNNISVSPSVKAAMQKISYLFPIGESEVSFTINKSTDGSVKICRGAFSGATNPLAHGGPGQTIQNQADESIAELVHRKGIGADVRIVFTAGKWKICFDNWDGIRNPNDRFIADTYSEAESKAREYLNLLTDPK